MVTTSTVQQLLPAPPLQPRDHKNAGAWRHYRDKWQTYYLECLLYWGKHNLANWGQAEVNYWTTLGEAQQAYEEVTGIQAIRPWGCLAAAFLAYEQAIQARRQGRLQRPGIDAWLEYWRAWRDYRHAWCRHWAAHGQRWRFEPEIDETRQKELDDCLKIVPDIEQDMYPFKGMKLSRADVEWLLERHEVSCPDGQIKPWPDILANWVPFRPGQAKRGLDLRGAHLEGIDLHRLPLIELRGGLTGEEWHNATPEQRKASTIQLQGANLRRACLRAASLRGANLEDADLSNTYLEQASFREANLKKAKLYSAFVDHETSLDGADLQETCIADIYWDNANLAEVAWPKVLGDECKARQTKKIDDYQTAVRANRQLAVALRDQGLNEEAARFAYRAQTLQRKLLGLQVFQQHRGQKFLSWLFSWTLCLVGGYGYKFWRIVLAYAVVILSFTFVYYFIHPTILQEIGIQGFYGSFIKSLASFHGRPLFILAHEQWVEVADTVPLFEAIIGLLLESVLVAMLVQRFLGKSGS